MRDDLFITIFIVSIIVGIFLTIRHFSHQKRTATGYVVSLSQHLSNLGMNVSLLSKDEEQPWMKGQWWQGSLSERILKVEDRNIDYIFVSCILGGEDPDTWILNCIVKSTKWPLSRSRISTALAQKRDAWIIGNVQDVEWKGDEPLANILNRDFALKQKLISNPDVNRWSFKLWISPKPEYGYYHIEIHTLIFPPRADFIETLDVIGKHLKMRS